MKQDRDRLDTETPEGKRAAQIKEQWDQFLTAFAKTNPDPATATSGIDANTTEEETVDVAGDRP